MRKAKPKSVDDLIENFMPDESLFDAMDKDYKPPKGFEEEK